MKEMKVMMFETLEKMNRNEQLIQTLTSPIEGMMNSVRSDILIVGGFSPGSLNSVEIFSWKKKKWFEIAKMKSEHQRASSFIYNDNLFVVGGSCKSIEALNLNQLHLTWEKFPADIPYECQSHQTVVFKHQILHIGGYIEAKGESHLIGEIQITDATSHVLKELCHMPGPRYLHGAVVVDDKVLIFGGQQTTKFFQVFWSLTQELLNVRKCLHYLIHC